MLISLFSSVLYTQSHTSDSLQSISQNKPERPKIALYLQKSTSLGPPSSFSDGRDIYHSAGTPYPVINTPGSGHMRTPSGGSGGFHARGFVVNDDTSKIIAFGKKYSNLKAYIEKDSVALKMLSERKGREWLCKTITTYNRNAGHGDNICYYSIPNFTESMRAKSDSITILNVKPIGQENKNNTAGNKKNNGKNLNFDNSLTPKK